MRFLLGKRFARQVRGKSVDHNFSSIPKSVPESRGDHDRVVVERIGALSDTRQPLAEEIFLEAVELSENDRTEFVLTRCGDDPELKRRVDELLAADDAANQDNFLESRFIAGANIAEPLPREPQAAASTGESPARFRIISRHEQGGLGEILVAHDTQLDRDVAVKQIRPKWIGHHEAEARFLQEAEVTGRLEHPGVVPVYAMGKWEDGRPFYAMRFIRGQTLKQVIAEHRQSLVSVDPQARSRQFRELLNRFVDVCNTIEYAHSRQVLHRDIKPSNIMVGAYGETLVVDWGLAKLMDAPSDQSMTAGFIAEASDSGSGNTRIGGAIGTPQYMSPEQADGFHDSAGVWTDVYLLGATLYHLLTGVAPHDESSVEKLILQIRQGRWSRPRDRDSEIPPPLESICLKAMSKCPDQRYPSALALAADIERWLADEPVSVYHDPSSLRMARWARKHRSLAMSAAVAACLVCVTSIVGSTLWSYQRTKQFAVEQERNAKEFQLRATQASRLSEKRDSAMTALTLSEREIQAGRFAAAQSILANAADSLVDEPSLDRPREAIVERLERVRRIVEFHQQSELCEQYNVMSRDTQGIMASSAALRSLGIWETRDWWAHLPDDELTPEQRDQLQWDVYQQWLMLDGMLVKTIGTRLFGTSNSGSSGRLLSAIRRLGSEAGKHEAALALLVSERIDEFRQAESVRWYRGIARFRLGTGRKVKAIDIGVPRNAADAQKLGVLCLISAMDPSFRVVFQDYKNQDPITAGRDLFLRSASLRPDHYWTQLALAQMQYFIAMQETNSNWEKFQPAIQTMGRCITINPRSCFALADRSSLFRFQSELLSSHASSTDTFEKERADELLRWSLQDAQSAYRSYRDHPWVGWTYGMALGAVQQTDQAIGVLQQASLATLPLMQLTDATLIGADDFRGRQDAADYVSRLVRQYPENSDYRATLASIRLNQSRHDESLEEVNLAIDLPNPSAHAYATRGMLRVLNDDVTGAAADFRESLARDPQHLWAAFGLARCDEAQGHFTSALSRLEASSALAITDEHRSAFALALGRVLAWQGRYDRAFDSFTLATQIQPACDLFAAVEPFIEQFKKRRSKGESSDSIIALQSFLKSVGELPRVTKINLSSSRESESYAAPILNGDFELGAMQYWSDQSGAAWRNDDGYSSSANVTKEHSHSGECSFHVSGRSRQEATGSTSLRGSTSQTFPVPANSRCRLTLWARGEGLGSNAFRVETRGQNSLSLPPGDFDWRKFQWEFEVGEPADSSLNVVDVTLDLVSSGPGDIWVDDIAVDIFNR